MTINFDDYVDTYEDSVSKLTSFFSKKRDYFDAYKVELAKKYIQKPKSVLDFGCGIGLCLNHLIINFKDSKIYATDDSTKSVEFAKNKFENVHFIDFKNIEEYSFDLIFIAGVFHHVTSNRRPELLKTLNKMLNQNGKIFITEHNPYNPITKKIVSQCPYDADAELIKMKKMKKILINADFKKIDSGYYLFFPYFFKFMRPTEKFMKWLPLGGQYFVVANK